VSRIEALRRIVEEAPASEAREIVGELAGLQADLLMRVAAPPRPAPAVQGSGEQERLLTVHAVAERLGKSPEWVYRNSLSWPFRRKLGRRTLRFEERGFERWLNRLPTQ
jgi:predicted DNA-binding transcriptional regulator AlpA